MEIADGALEADFAGAGIGGEDVEACFCLPWGGGEEGGGVVEPGFVWSLFGDFGSEGAGEVAVDGGDDVREEAGPVAGG